MKYFGALKVQLDEVACLAISELLQSPSMGEFNREKFVNGWKSVGYVKFQQSPVLHRSTSTQC